MHACVLSTVEASTPPTEFCIELVTHVSTNFTRLEDVDLNRDGVDDFTIIEALDIWNFTGTLEGTVALDIFLVGKIPCGPTLYFREL